MIGTDRHRVLGAAVAANVGQFGTRTVLSPLVPLIVVAFGVSTADVGVALALSWAAFGIAQYPSGALADRYGERRVITWALLGAIGGSAFVAIAPSFATFTVAATLLGGATGLYFAVGTALLDRRFDDTATAFGVHSSGAPLAGLLLPVIATAAAARWNWRAGVLVGTATAMLGLVIFRLTVDPMPPVAPDESLNRLHPRAALSIFRRPGVARTTAIGVVAIYVFQSFVSFFPTYLQEYRGFSPAVASTAFSAVFLLIVLGNPIAGWIADRRGTDTGIALTMLVAAVGFLATILGSGPVTLLGIALVGAGVTWGGPLQSRVMTAVDDDGGTGFAIVRSTYLLLGSSGTAITGWLAETAGWPIAVGVMSGLLLVVVVALAGASCVRRGRRVARGSPGTTGRQD